MSSRKAIVDRDVERAATLFCGRVDIVTDAAERLLHPLLASRWSPTTFDTTVQVSPVEVESLLEAARWAPSAGNSQPWAFIVGRREDLSPRALAVLREQFA